MSGPDLVVAGAGMAGLSAAAHAVELGADVLVLEKGDRVGGSMLLSSGFVWRYRTLERFRRECPRGDPGLQRLVHTRLDRDLAWLERLGARVLERTTGNPLTEGVRFCVRSLTDALVRRCGVRLRTPLERLPDGIPVVLATGGFQGSTRLVREHVTAQASSLVLRAAPWSSGDGLRLALGAGAGTSAGLDEFFGRTMPARPARVRPRDFVALAQLYAQHAEVESTEGARYQPRSWSEIDVVQWTARQPGARARYRVPTSALGRRVRGRTVGEMVAAAERAGAPVERRRGSVTVDVVAGITTTLGGIAVDVSCRAAPGVWAAGADVGGISTGGYTSGLATALVLGRVAAASALEGR